MTANEDDDFQARYAENRQRLAEVERDIAFTLGKIEQVYDSLRDDPEHVELMRGLAWARNGARMGLADGRVIGAPEGWPEGVGPEEFMGEWIEDKKAEHRRPIIRDNDPTDAPVSPAVKQFREMLG
jgi:hypothetical protein